MAFLAGFNLFVVKNNLKNKRRFKMKTKCFVRMGVVILLVGVLAGSAAADEFALQEKLSKDL